MIKKPKFSIIIPVYNVERYLSACMESVLHQTLRDIEIICVNDGTKDHSRDILAAYQQHDPRIIVVDKENGGLSSARNAGLKAATGEYILFLDSDDALEPNTCERLYLEVIEHHPEIIVFGSKVFPANPHADFWLINNLSPRSTIYKSNSIQALIYEKGAHPFVWRNCFKHQFLTDNALLFDENARFAEDILFQFYAFPLANNIIFISDKLYRYRWCRDNSLMANAAKNQAQKYKQHLEVCHKVAHHWESKNWLAIHSFDFLTWTINFLGWDLKHFSGTEKNEMIYHVAELWMKYDLCKYVSKLPAKKKYYYYYFMRIHNQYKKQI